jgi:hypothetical protein
VLSPVEIRRNFEISGENKAFEVARDKFYLAEEFILANVNDLNVIALFYALIIACFTDNYLHIGMGGLAYTITLG